MSMINENFLHVMGTPEQVAEFASFIGVELDEGESAAVGDELFQMERIAGKPPDFDSDPDGFKIFVKENWGTARISDVSRCAAPGRILYYFQSISLPPLAGIDRLASRFTEILFVLNDFQLGTMTAGHGGWANGTRTAPGYEELSGSSSDLIAFFEPRSQSMAQWVREESGAVDNES